MNRAHCAFALGIACAAGLVLALTADANDGSSGAPIVVHVNRGGFHWVDAALGLLAGAGLAVAALGIGGLHATRHTPPSNPQGGNR